jgi:50S ribosomal protein L16 3-hydroxylase
MALPIEIVARRDLPLGMPAKAFLRDYWQKRPLLVRGAFPDFRDPLTPNDLAGLACEELALARLVIHDSRRDRWTLRNGPFNDADFANLPTRDWTVLVQDVDKWDSDVADLPARFAFLPDWRIDDVMVSYAVDQGSVGAHVDQYDVFLLQGLGQRRWQISTDPRAPRDFRDDVELKLLREFAPTHEWTLRAGDMLYLPPGVPHHGVAVGECLTYSIGMRAPSQSELLIDFAESLADSLPEDLRFSDPDIEPSNGDGEIDDAAFARVLRAMPWLKADAGFDGLLSRTYLKPPVRPEVSKGDLFEAAVLRRVRAPKNLEKGGDGCSGSVDSSLLRTWFARFITRYRSAHTAMPRTRKLTDAEFDRAFARPTQAVRNPWSRAAWVRSGRDAMLFVAGTDHACSVPFARLVCSRAPIPLDRVRSRRDRDALRSLIDLGHVTLASTTRRSRQ